ncbi:MAG TPA: TetR/AcrR family transcriptional regulator [Caulobacteraceae bacterium]|nr:TetR/AcrR family transcriptional regulator [Caulobacteraceae bacterium]
MNRKVEQGVATRREIAQAAMRLFAELGYGGVSIEAVLAATGVSRGALYHHFAGKEALFEAAYEAMEADLMRRTTAATADATSPADGLRTGCDAFLDLVQEDAVRQVVLIDAPSVLGWEKWREIDERYGFGLLKTALSAASAGGSLPADLVDSYAHILMAALTEVAMLIARADDRPAAAALGKRSIRVLLERLLSA